jgi:hypothetical protein
MSLDGTLLTIINSSNDIHFHKILYRYAATPRIDTQEIEKEI